MKIKIFTGSEALSNSADTPTIPTAFLFVFQITQGFRNLSHISWEANILSTLLSIFLIHSLKSCVVGPSTTVAKLTSFLFNISAITVGETMVFLF